MRGVRAVGDVGGITVNGLSWLALWFVAHDVNGVVSKERIRALYDGTLFSELAAQCDRKRRARPLPAPPPSHGCAA